jgi:hypothetical protein
MNVNLKRNCELELGVTLKTRFINEISSVVGRSFEDLICKYFKGNFVQTNVNNVESAFSDVRQRDTYFSVKYSQAVKSKTLSTVTGDNFRFTTIAKMISQSVLMSEGKYTFELGRIKSRKELEKFMEDKTITTNKFGIIAGYAYDTFLNPDTICLKVMTSNILTGQELYNKLLKVYDEFSDMKKELRSHTVTKIFGHDTTQEFELPAGDSEISLMKDSIQKDIIDVVFETKEELIEKLLQLDFINNKQYNTAN